MRKLSPGPLVVATHNRGKFDEIKSLLEPRGFEVTCNADHGLGEPDETETSFAGNALIKARAAAKALNRPAIADDSGLAIAALNGAPGVYTADWAETGNGRDFTMAMTRAWDELQATGTPAPHVAAFHCVIAVVWPDGEEAVFDGQVPGQIVWPPRGDAGHGYDPVFQPDGATQTFAEMPADQKNSMSHRGRAIAAFLKACLD